MSRDYRVTGLKRTIADQEASLQHQKSKHQSLQSDFNTYKSETDQELARQAGVQEEILQKLTHQNALLEKIAKNTAPKVKIIQKKVKNPQL